MAEYYAVERSHEYLAHYGVKGMRWGVQKAKAKGNAKLLGRHYGKAMRKLAKLNKRANVQEQIKVAQKHDKNAKAYRTLGRVGLGLAIPGTAGMLTSRFLIEPKIWEKMKSNKQAALGEYEKRMQDLYNTDISSHHYRTLDDGIRDVQQQLSSNKRRYDESITRIENKARRQSEANHKLDKISGYVAPIGVGSALGGYGLYGVSKLKANKARKLASKEGHRAAVAERDAWQREMNKAFAGTQYANGGSQPRQGNKKRRRK